ncbi:methionine synthase [Tsukamurella paurometabola]|uniref:Cobalamin-independent synthase, Catalytic domain n=1 Tax=Tsukamurella paurometabola TaxID=2061 RepID=A0A3P8ME93_TSUPA|nr:methionine synthase [Tsukamurella paurometabola]UEA82724.1 methionine synthase [Tsukamurella paurometabola]VDR39793.1 Cobalamin-independent synthase, Catalytic domain [Tsukamurella paurometabola]
MSDPLAPLVGGVTAIGSVPGTDPREAAATVVGELEVPFLPELPNRGIGADMIGRSAALLVDIGFDVSTTGYRIGVPGGRVARLAGDHLERDIDALEEAYEVARRRGLGLVKTQVAGPLTLAAGLELPNGHRVARDRGAMRDVAASLAEGLVRHVADLRRRLGSDVVLQLDEPSMWSVVHGTVPALTKLDPVRAVPAPEAAELLASVVAAVDEPVLLHLCGEIDWDVVRRVPVDGALLDATRLTAADYEGFGELAESRTVVGLGLAPAVPTPRRRSPQDLSAPALRLYDEVGLPRRDLARATVTPVCGSPGSPGIRPILDACKEIRSVLAEESVA